MIVRSDIITYQDVVRAVLAVPGVDFQDTRSREGWFVPVRTFAPKRFARGYEFFLSGTSRHRAQHDRDEFAATWVEWGVVIDALYRVDPEAQIAWYTSREDFLAKTANDYRVRRGEITDVPWLVAA